jgi:predicted ATP-dependent endonuclease of OLD family
MRIESVAIKNLRCIKEGIANLGAYTCLVGPNGAGKSTVLHALNIFFRHIECKHGCDLIDIRGFLPARHNKTG